MLIPEEPELFPNQPNLDEHVDKHQKEDSPFAPKIVKVTDVATRLKILEERYITLRKKAQLSEQNIIEADKEHFEEMRLLNDSLLDLKRSLKGVLEKISMLSDEVGNFAYRTDMITLQRYIEFWEPIDFVTRKEVNDFLRRKFREHNVSFESKSDGKKANVKEEGKTSKKKKSKVSIEDAYPDTD